MTAKIIDLKKEYGRVVSHPSMHDGQPFIKSKNIPVLDVLDLIDKGYTDSQIIRMVRNGLSQSDIDICRSYQARFLSNTLNRAFDVENDRNFFMLDENISHFLLHDVVRMFGRSSHVFADGLYGDNNDDEKNIWAHLVENSYRAILTADNDFKSISIRHRGKLIREFNSVSAAPVTPPVVIHITKNISRNDVRDWLMRHKDDIRRYVNDNDCAYATITLEKGFQKHEPDDGLIERNRRHFGPKRKVA